MPPWRAAPRFLNRGVDHRGSANAPANPLPAVPDGRRVVARVPIVRVAWGPSVRPIVIPARLVAVVAGIVPGALAGVVGWDALHAACNVVRLRQSAAGCTKGNRSQKP